ncbi:MAG: phenylacetate--CoA ligase family protein [Alphaproteobacteria bacterium]|nr:MAG: phenylacetate--CoA ligase family protein [Alphaproteobacteria bacterium]
MDEQDRRKKANGSTPDMSGGKTVSVAGRLRPPPAAPVVTNHFLPPATGGKELAGADLANHLAQTERWGAESLVALQLRQAAELVRYAQRFSPFHKDRLAGVDLAPGAALTPDAFAAIPFLTREDVQNAKATLFSTQLPRGHGPAFDLHTTGSSGQPVHVKSTKYSSLFNMAVTMRGHRWFERDLAGINVTIKVISGSLGRTENKSWAAGGTGAGFTYSNRIPVAQLYDWLLADDPHYLQCHPSILLELIHRSRDMGAKPARLRDVRSMGEILEPGLRALCQREWGVPVRDNYSCEELATLALTCPEHDHLHIQAERVLLEILDDENCPCAPGEVGRVVVTGLINFATPLIRYELGDRAVAGAPCPCGRGLGVIERIIGRERLPVILPSGDRVFPVLDAEPLLLKGGVRQYQLVQTSTEEIDLKLVADPRLSEAEEADIAAHLQRNFGHPFRFNFIYVDEIPREASGKFQIFKSELI